MNTAPHPNVGIVIPAFNEQGNLPKLLGELLELGFLREQIVVVDDASWDATAEMADKVGVAVVSLPVNLGIGGSVQTGWIWTLKHSFKIAVQVDGDGQHPPAEVLRLLTLFKSSNADMLVGSRFLSPPGEYRSTWTRRLGIHVLRLTGFIVTGRWLSDPSSGLRVVGGQLLREFAREYPSDYPEPESLVLAVRRGYRVVETQAIMRSRAAGHSTIGFLHALYYLVKVPCAILIRVFERKYASTSTT